MGNTEREVGGRTRGTWAVMRKERGGRRERKTEKRSRKRQRQKEVGQIVSERKIIQINHD